MWNFIKSVYRWLTELVSAYTLAAALIPTTVITAMTAFFARYDGEPWHLVIFYSSAVLCFLTLIIGGYFWARIHYDHFKRISNPQDKIAVSPQIWYALVGKKVQFLSEMQLGVTVQNNATFPMGYRLVKLRTTFDKYHMALRNLPWPDDVLAGNGEWRNLRDDTINYQPKKKLEQLGGEIEYTIEYWKIGDKRKYTKSDNIALFLRFDLPERSWTYRSL
jgi:hypothetical protein